MNRTQYLSTDTIHALATPVGGALSIIRMSGPRAIEVLSAIEPETDVRERSPRALFRSKLRDGQGKLLDDAMSAVFTAPATQTGEDLVELYLHGGATVAERVLARLTELGSRQALPGEFSFRAVRNGKVTIVQAQAVADLIAAKNAGAADLALEKLEGSQGRLVGELAEGLRKLSAMGELGIDFADQDVEELSLPVLKERTNEILARLRALEASFDRGRKIQEGVRAAFVGRPNAGKSSFFNALLGEERSIVSETAGTTRDVVRESLTLNGKRGSVTLRLEDTAGIRGATSDGIEREGISRSVRAAGDADLVVFVADAGAGESEWEETAEVWNAIGTPVHRALGILTKTDRVGAEALERDRKRLEKLGLKFLYSVSSQNGDGVHAASEGIVQFCERFTHRSAGEVLLTRLDHLHAVRETVGHLERALDAESEDLFAADIRHALTALGPVIGETPPDDILGRIFSDFCIGK